MEHRELERSVDAALRAQPMRRAPPGLTARVLEQIERRRAAPWWRKGFLHWPWAARGGLLLASAAAAGLAVAATTWLAEAVRSAPVPEALGRFASALHGAATLASTLGRTAAELLPAASPALLHFAAIGAMLAYALVFGIGAIAYRTLYLNR